MSSQKKEWPHLQRVGLKISGSTVAQGVDDVSFALLRVQLFMLATSSAM